MKEKSARIACRSATRRLHSNWSFDEAAMVLGEMIAFRR